MSETYLSCKVSSLINIVPVSNGVRCKHSSDAYMWLARSTRRNYQEKIGEFDSVIGSELSNDAMYMCTTVTAVLHIFRHRPRLPQTVQSTVSVRMGVPFRCIP